jgi:hypothetical protein
VIKIPWRISDLRNIKLTLQTRAPNPCAQLRIQAVVLCRSWIIAAVFLPEAFRAIRSNFFAAFFLRTGLIFAISSPVAGAMLEPTRFLSASFLAAL